jgi:hypothetical protein
VIFKAQRPLIFDFEQILEAAFFAAEIGVLLLNLLPGFCTPFFPPLLVVTAVTMYIFFSFFGTIGIPDDPIDPGMGKGRGRDNFFWV